MVVPVLAVTGPVGVGKSAVLAEADVLLIKAGARHATVEVEDIARYWPKRDDAQENDPIAYRNLACVWANFAARGAERLLLSDLIEHRSQLRHIAQAIPNSTITVVRLRAPLATLEQRLLRREPYPASELSAARYLAPRMDQCAVEDHLVDNGDRPLREVATEALCVAGWLR